jgi:hypothetical protein
MDRNWPTAVIATLVLAGALGGCADGADSPEGGKPPGTTPAKTAEHPKAMGDCQRVGDLREGTLRLCFKANADDHGRFLLESGSSERELAVSPPGPTASATGAGMVGHWAWAALSPDGTTILAQWSAECEVPTAFLIPADGGSPTPITGEEDWAKSPESVALGWTIDGRAIAFLPKGPPCGNGSRVPGIYLYSSPGEGKLLLAGKRSPIDGSKTPRTVSALRRTAS